MGPQRSLIALVAAVCVAAAAAPPSHAQEGKPAAKAADAPAGKSFVLPPAAGAALKAVLGTNINALAGKYIFQKATLDRSQAVAHFGASLEGDGTLVVTLIHPGAAAGRPVVEAGPFSILRIPGPVDEEALSALVARLLPLNPSVYWIEVGEDPEAAPPAPAPEMDPEIVNQAREQVRRALAAVAAGDGGVANKILRAISRDDEQRRAVGLDLAEAWYAVAGTKQAKGATEMWLLDQAGAELDPVEKWRGVALVQEPVVPTDFLGDLKEAERLCDVDVVTRSMVAAGAAEQALSLLEIVAKDTSCPSVHAEHLEMLLAKGEVASVERRAEELVDEFPEDETLRAIRSRLLLASDQPREAAAVLEPVLWQNPSSGLIGAYLGAVHRVDDASWQSARLADHLERSDADADDHVSAFLAGVQLHYIGEYQRSDEYLARAESTFIDQPRMHIYRAMNAFNRGDAATAMKLIDTAEALPNPDPDTHYCRAEVLRWSDPQAALAELKRYLAHTKDSRTTNALKQERVRRMAELLGECIAKDGKIPCVAPFEHPRGSWANREPTELDLLMPWLGELCIALGVLILLLVRLSGRAARAPERADED